VDTDTLVEHLTPNGGGKVEMTICRALALQKILMFGILVTMNITLAVATMR
jgi:hypothetical protein